MDIQKISFKYNTVGNQTTLKTDDGKKSHTSVDNTDNSALNNNTTNTVRNNALRNISFGSNEYLIRQKQEELVNLFKIKDASEGYYPKVEDVRLSTFVKNFKDKIIYDNYALDGHPLLKKNELLAVLEKAKSISPQEIEEDAKKINHPAAAIQLYFGETLRKEFLEKFAESVATDSSENFININYHLHNVKTELEKKHSPEFLNEEAKSKLEYVSDDEINIKKIELTKEDMDLLKSKIEHHKVAEDNYNLDELANMLISEYVGGNYNMKRLPPHIVTACLQTQKRYNSEDKTFHPSKREPVYRWLCLQDVTDFIKNFPEVGQEYSFPRLQSCSKNSFYAENEYRDDSSDMQVKLVFHPLGDTSQAYDIGDRKYGANEVIYPPNAKFKVIGKEIVEAKKDNEKYATASTSFYRYVVHLQEVAPEK